MRTALISDIHGNYDGLLSTLEDIDSQNCDRILCLGDLVDGGPQSLDVVRLIWEQSIVTVQGNHDEYPNMRLPSDAMDYLQSLPEVIVEDQIIYTHTSPRKKKYKISSPIEAWNVFEDTPYRRIFVGDVHIPLIFGQKCREKVSATSYEILYDQDFALEADDRYIICVGAVGYSRDAYHWLRYAIYDDQRDTIMFRSPEGPLLSF